MGKVKIYKGKEVLKLSLAYKMFKIIKSNRDNEVFSE